MSSSISNRVYPVTSSLADIYIVPLTRLNRAQPPLNRSQIFDRIHMMEDLRLFDVHLHLQVCALNVGGPAENQKLDRVLFGQDARFQDPDTVVSEALASNVERLGCAGTQESDWNRVHANWCEAAPRARSAGGLSSACFLQVLNTSRRHPKVVPNLGLHPWYETSTWALSVSKKSALREAIHSLTARMVTKC